MKKTVRLVSLALVTVMALLALVSCSSFGTVKSRFEKAGYTYVETEADKEKAENFNKVVASFDDKEVKVTAHLFETKDAIIGAVSVYALVLEFESNEALTKELSESETLKGFVKDAQKSDYIEGNCLLVPLSLTKAEDMIKTFKGEK